MRILHLFNWKLEDIFDELETIGNQGFDAIQINPIQPLKNEFDNAWWQTYQPIDFSVGNRFGTKNDLRKLCNLAKFYGITVIADVVCNHLAGADDGALKPHENVKEIYKNNPLFWKEMKPIYNWDDRNEVTSLCMGLPTLKTCNYDLQDRIIDFLNELIDLGVGGFRFDSAKNIALPKEGCDFWPRVMNNLNRKDLFIYGEVIFADTYLIDEYCKYINVVTNCCGSDKDKIIKFSESHDTYLEFGYTRDISSHQITKNYQYLTKEFPNTLYYARPFDDEWKSDEVNNANNSLEKVYKKCL